MTDCDCAQCCSACRHKPGWFAPDDLPPLAAFLGVPIEEVFGKFLAVDFCCAQPGDEDPTAREDVFVISPAVTTMRPGDVFPMNPLGLCVFYRDGQCAIHAAKPTECRQMMHDDDHATTMARKAMLRRSWHPRQAEISAMAGYRPEVPEVTILDEFEMMLTAMEPK